MLTQLAILIYTEDVAKKFYAFRKEIDKLIARLTAVFGIK